MNWNEFFRMRRRLTWFKRLAGGVPAVCAFFAAEGAVLSMPIFDPTRPILGLDPLIIVGCASLFGIVGSFTLGSAAMGWAWQLARPRIAAQMNQMQSSFYHRVTKYRANVPPNPTQMNFAFDFYGEKIKSVADYRAWLHRQRQMINERKFQL